MNLNYENLCIYTLNRVFGYEPAIAHCLIDNLGSAGAVFEMDGMELMSVLGVNSRFKSFINHSELEKSRKELQWLLDRGYHFLPFNDPAFPSLLKDCPDSPLGLYLSCSCDPASVFRRRAVAVVGTRDISPYGREWCRRIVMALATSRDKPAIVSGLAMGTDIIAHLTALECGLPTIGVMATGIETVYPVRHRQYARRIIETEGSALATDYPMGTAPVAINFTRRNRIIAGLSEATVLIESKIKGGGLITANLAFSYERDVYALPGRIDDPCSEGCNYLIRKKIAEPITDADSFMESIGLGTFNRRRMADLEAEITESFQDSLSPEELSQLVKIALLIKKERGITPEGICSRLGYPYNLTIRFTGLLESEGFIDVDLLQRCCLDPGKSF